MELTRSINAPPALTRSGLTLRVAAITLVTTGTSYAFSRVTGLVHSAVDVPVGVPALLVAAALTIRSPRRYGWRWGSTARHWRVVLSCAVGVALVVGSFRLASGQVPYAPSFAEVVIVPIGEEGLFRGFVLVAVTGVVGAWMRPPSATATGVAVSALAFGVAHLGNLGYVPAAFVLVQAVAATAFGLLAGWVRVRTDSLAGPVVLHAVMNAAAVL